MYNRGIIHIAMIIVGLVIIAILIGVFTMSNRSASTVETTTETTTVYPSN